MLSRARAFLLRYRDVQWTFADQALVSGANFLTGVVVARMLGIAEFGRFTLLWLIVIFFWNLQTYLLVAPMQSIGPKLSAAERPAYFGAVLAQQAGFAVLTVALLALGAGAVAFLAPEYALTGQLAPLAVAAVTQQTHDLARRYYLATDRPGAAFLNDAGRYGVQFAALYLAAAAGWFDVGAALWLIAFASALATASAAVRVVPDCAWPRAMLGSALARHWRSGAWLAAASILQWLAANLVMFVAGAAIAAEATGALRAAQNIVAGLQVLYFTIANRSAVRASVHMAAGGAAALRRYVLRITVVGGAATALVLAALVAAPETWLRLVYGAGFAGHGELILWFAAIAFVEFFGFPVRAALRALEVTRPVFVAAAIGAAVILVVAYPAVHAFGTRGAAAGMLLAASALTAWLVLALLRNQEFRAGGGSGV